MSDALSFAEIDGQHVELLPARTVLSLFIVGGDTNNCSSSADKNVQVGVSALNNLLGILAPGGGETDISQGASTVCKNG